MELSGQHHAPAAFPTGKNSVPVKYGDRWASEMVCAFWRKSLASTGIRASKVSIPIKQYQLPNDDDDTTNKSILLIINPCHEDSWSSGQSLKDSVQILRFRAGLE